MSVNYAQNFFSSSTPEALTDDQMQLKNKFDSIYHELEALVRLGSEKGGLNKNDLLNIYIQGINSTNGTSCAETEFGTQHIFDGILSKHNPKLLGTHDDYVMSELMHALARGVSIGCMSFDAILEGKGHVSLRA